MRKQISEDLTSGATLIVADTALHSSVLPEGDDFIVRTNDSPESGSEPDKTPAKVVAKPKPKTVKKRVVRAQAVRTRTRTVTRTRGFRLFSRRRR
jgi:hypothetical protein